MLEREVSLFLGISNLVVNGQLEEGMILGRPLYEESLALQFIARQSDLKLQSEYVLSYAQGAIQGWLGSVRKTKNDPDFADQHEEMMSTWHHHLEAVKEERRRLGYAWRKLPSENDMAIKLGRQNEWFAYEVSQQFVHGRVLAMLSRMDFLTDGTLVLGSRDDHDQSLIPLVTLWAVSSILHAHRAVCSIFSLDVADSLAESWEFLRQSEMVP